MDEDVHGKTRLRSELRGAIERGELEAFFQPLVDLESRRITGAEALVRWRHPEEGLLTPDRFLSVAEESGMIQELDAFVLEEACRNAVAWRDRTTDEFSVNVNLSGRTLERDDIVQLVTGTLDRTGLPATALVLEMTENILVQSTAVWRLSELKQLGVRLAVDDFGTGYSSLNYLKQFPVDFLKIDRSFIQGIAEDPRAHDLTHAIVRLADALQLGVVAEGVEETAQADCLVNFGVRSAQGYLFSRPVQADVIGRLLEEELIPAGGAAVVPSGTGT